MLQDFYFFQVPEDKVGVQFYNKIGKARDL